MTGHTWLVGSILVFASACHGGLGSDQASDTGTYPTGNNPVIELQVGSYPTAGPSDLSLNGGISEPIDSQTGQVVDQWRPTFSAAVYKESLRLPYVGPSNLDECWSYVYVVEALSDRLGPSLPLTIGSNELELQDIGGGIYIAYAEGAVADSIEQKGGALTFGATSPGISLPESFDLLDRSATWAEMAEQGVFTLSWTPASEDTGSYILVTGQGNDSVDLEDQENFACALYDDGAAVIDVGRPRPDVSLVVGRAQSSVFDSDYGPVLATLYNNDVFIDTD